LSIDNELNPVLGIDLGTTFSAISRWDGRGSRTYQTSSGEDTLQSVVYLDPKTNELLVGKVAYKRGLINPENMVMGVKRKMDNRGEKITIAGRTFSPIELSAEILKKLYRDVQERYPKDQFKGRGTVVTVPYYFKAHQCENTRKAAELADIECIGIIQEPIAASLSYAWQLVQERPDREYEENILVFDLGGGTFDLTLFKLCQTKNKLLFEVLASGGDDRLGGLDFDECLADLFLKKGKLSLENIEPMLYRKGRQKLLEQAVEAKITLSATNQTPVTITDVIPGRHIDIEVTRAEFEECIGHYMDKIETIVENLWDAANMKPSEVDRVIRVGGSSNIPCMKELLGDLIGEDKIYGNTNAALCVAEGASLYASYLDDREVFGREIEIRTRTCHALGIEIAGGEFYPLIASNRKTPCEHQQIFTTDEDDMTILDINIYQGSSKMVKNNSLIGTINITGLPKRPKGQLDIEVAFRVSEDQALSVTVEAEGMKKSVAVRFA